MKPRKGRFSRSLITHEDMDLFYGHLTEALEKYKGYGVLPNITHTDTYRRIFQLAYVIHFINREEDIKDINDSENWLLTYDERAQWLVSFPEELCPPGMQTMEQLAKRLNKAKRRMSTRAKLYEAEFGKFDLRIRQGGIYLRHSGPVADTLPEEWLVDKGIG